MGLPSKVGWNIWSGVLSAAAVFASQKVVTAGWKKVMGSEPPEPNDPDTPASHAFAWAALSGIGLGVVQLLVNRFAARRWMAETGKKAPSIKNVSLRL